MTQQREETAASEGVTGPERAGRLVAAERQLQAALAILLDDRADDRDACAHLWRGWQAVLYVIDPDRAPGRTDEQVLTRLGALELRAVHAGEREQWERSLEVVVAVASAEPWSDDLPRPERLLLRWQCTILKRAVRQLRDQATDPAERRLNRIIIVGLSAATLLLAVLAALVWWPRPSPSAAGGTLAQRRQGGEHTTPLKGERAWRAAYFPSPGFSGAPVMRLDSAVDFNWEDKAPFHGFPADHYSVRWDTCMDLQRTSRLLFELSSDDGARLLINGRPVIDLGGTHPLQSKKIAVELREGSHHLIVDYQEESDVAAVSLKLASDGPRPGIRLPGREPCAAGGKAPATGKNP